MPEGYWLYELLEADCTIPSEYILMMHYLDEIDPALEAKIAVYLRANQADHGGWPLYYGGELDISATVKAYYAHWKLAGDSPGRRLTCSARALPILERGGAARSNVFTRASRWLCSVRCRGAPCPYIPVETHVDAELVSVPSQQGCRTGRAHGDGAVVYSLHVQAARQESAQRPHIRELFTTPPEQEHHYFRLPATGRGARRLARAFFPAR